MKESELDTANRHSTEGDGDKKLPSVSFVIPVLNAEALLDECLRSIVSQVYPEDLVDIIVADGGSEDRTVQKAEKFGAKVISNPKRLAEPGVSLGFEEAGSDIVFVMAADNALPRTDWIRLMVRPFTERSDVMGVFTQILPHPDDNSFTRYYCLLHVEPFTWFVYKNASNPRCFRKVYSEEAKTDEYVIYNYTVRTHPLVAMAQGFGVRRNFVRQKRFCEDDILPIIQMIEEAQNIAYVPAAGIYHHHLRSFSHFLAKYRWRIRNSLYEKRIGFDSRRMYMTRRRRVKKYLFLLYGITLVFPLIDSFILWFRERDACMLWHMPASVGLCGVIVAEYLRLSICRFCGLKAEHKVLT